MLSQVFKYIKLPEVLSIIKTPGVPPHILDVRSKSDISNGMIKGAKWAPNMGIDVSGKALIEGAKDIEKLIPNKNDPVVIYCNVGRQANTFAQRMSQWGYKDIAIYHEGWSEYKHTSHPKTNVE